MTAAASPEQIRTTLVGMLLELDGVRSAFAYEPEQLGPLPCCTLVLRSLDPAEVATGPRLDVTWRFELRLYFGLSDWVASQQQIDALVPQVLRLWASDPSLDGLIEWWRIRDGGEPVEFRTDESWMRKTLVVEAVVEEVGA